MRPRACATRLWARRPAEPPPGRGGPPRRLVRPVCAPRPARGRRPRSHVHRGADPGHWIVTFPWRGAERARTLAEAAWQLAGERRPTRGRPADHPDVGAAASADRRRRRRARPDDGPRRRPPHPGRLHLRHERQEHGDPDDRPHPGPGRPPGRHDDLRRDRGRRAAWWSRATGPAPAARRRSSAAATSTWPCSRRPAAGSSCEGVGYESNEASVLTNVSSDHLDLQGIHTLAGAGGGEGDDLPDHEPDGWVVLNADDPHVAAVAGLVRARGRLLLLAGGAPPPVLRRTSSAAGAPTSSGAGRWPRSRPARRGRSSPIDEIPVDARRAGPPQRRQRAGRGRRWRPGAGGDARAGRRRAARLPARRRIARRGGSTSSGIGKRGRDRRLRPQRGRARGAARRGRRDRRRAARPGPGR